MAANDQPPATQQDTQRPGSHLGTASSGLRMTDPEVQTDTLGRSPRHHVTSTLLTPPRHQPARSQSDSTYNIKPASEEDLRRLSENPLKFLSLPSQHDEEDDGERVMMEEDEGGVGRSSLGITGTGGSITASPHTTHSYRLRQSSQQIPISRTNSSSVVSLAQPALLRTPRSGYGTIPNTPNRSHSVVSSTRDSSKERTRPRTAHPAMTGLFAHGNDHIPPGRMGGRAVTDGYLTRRPSLRDLGRTPSKLTGIFRSMRRRRTSASIARSVGSYDGDILQDGGDAMSDDQPEATANGIRVWYSSYVTIDWLHDQIKDSMRRGRFRRARAHRSIGGMLRSLADRLSGWVVVTLIGITTAIIAFCIIKTETLLFDLKQGYCSANVLAPKKECCPSDQHQNDFSEPHCSEWNTWASVLSERHTPSTKAVRLNFVAYLTVALVLAMVSSIMTVYITSSANHDEPHAYQHSDEIPEVDPKAQAEESPLLRQTQGPKKKIMYFAAGSGIPEVKTILSGFVIHGYLGISTLLVKSVGLALSVASGLSLGKEGPICHIAAAVGNIICRQFPKFERNEAKKREILSAACASGVAVAFGAPIGGVLFSLEEVSYYFPPKVMWRAFFSAAVATLTLRVLNPYGNGRLVLLETHYTQDYHTNVIYGVAIVLGIYGGLYGAYFSKFNIMYSKRVRQGTWLARHPIVEVAMVVTITTILLYPSAWGRMGGVEYVAQLFGECAPGSTSKLCDLSPDAAWKVVAELAAVMALRAGLTVITFGIKLPAGIFIPSLAAGAAFGRICGISMQQLLPHYAHHIMPGVWALIGAAATLAGVTRTTVSLVVIILELTGDMAYSVPTAITVLVAKAVAEMIESEGIYDLVIRMNKFPYLDAKKQHIFGSHRVVDMVDSTLPILKIDDSYTVSQLEDKLDELLSLDNIDGSLPCVFAYEVEDELALGVMGLLSVNDLRHALDALADQPEAACNLMPRDRELEYRTLRNSIYSLAESEHEDPYDLVPFIDQAPLTISIDSPLELVQQLFVRMGARTIVVTDRKGRYRGLILKKQWLKFLEEIDVEKD